MMIEKSTNYSYKLKYMENPTFDKVRDLAIKFMRELPKPLQDELYEALNRGVDILDSEPQMVTYLYAFGPMHQAKLNYAFKHLPEEFFAQPEINIIDYGCGQALGIMCYADFLRENGYSQKVKTNTLIEPSKMCLKRAALHASVFFPGAEIKTVNKTFDELDKEDIYNDEDNTTTLHILSNVLDILDFDLEGFAGLIKNQMKGYNQFVCVSPFIGDSNRDTRTIAFPTLLNADSSMPELLDKYQLRQDKIWTCLSNCFSLDKFDANKKANNIISKYYESAKKGDAEAQFKIAQLYCELLNNKTEAFKWFKMSAINNSEAQMCLGCCFRNGYGVEIDLPNALQWYFASAKSDNVRAMASLGICYQYGYGVEKDMTTAAEWYKKAANKNYSVAQWRYGICYEYGDGVEKDTSKAFELYKTAAEEGNSAGQFHIGRCYEFGIGVDKNNSIAAKWYQKAAKQGNADAQYRLGLLYVKGEGVIKSGATALFWIRKAANQGLKKASDLLAKIDNSKLKTPK